MNLETAVEYLDSSRSAFVLSDFQLLRSLTFRVTATAGCCAAWQTTKIDGLPHGSLLQPIGNCRI